MIGSLTKVVSKVSFITVELGQQLLGSLRGCQLLSYRSLEIKVSGVCRCDRKMSIPEADFNCRKHDT
jgi:hypothetical protein